MCFGELYKSWSRERDRTGGGGGMKEWWQRTERWGIRKCGEQKKQLTPEKIDSWGLIINFILVVKLLSVSLSSGGFILRRAPEIPLGPGEPVHMQDEQNINLISSLEMWNKPQCLTSSSVCVGVFKSYRICVYCSLGHDLPKFIATGPRSNLSIIFSFYIPLNEHSVKYQESSADINTNNTAINTVCHSSIIALIVSLSWWV